MISTRIRTARDDSDGATRELRADALRALPIALACLALAGIARGQVHEDRKLLANDGLIDEQFGFATAVDGGVAAIGARHDGDNGGDAGSAYLFDVFTGSQLFKLLPSDGAAGDAFGTSIAKRGDLVVVGAPFDGGSGSAYLFDAATGGQLLKLLPSDGAAGDEFGCAVAIDGGVVVVGARRDDDNGNDSGSVYFFDASTGAQVRKVVPSDGAAIDNFGEAVAADAGVVAVGAHGDADNGFLSGSAYLFDLASGAQLFKLLPSDGATNDFFGSAIAIDAGVVVVGAWAKSVVFDHSGAAYLFDAATGSQIARMVPSDAADRDHFGFAVAVDAGLVAIGAEQDDDNGFTAGSAYLFDDGGAQRWKLLASDGAASDLFGSAIAVEAGVIVVGAHSDAEGSAYVFEDVGSVGTQQCFCDLSVAPCGNADPAAGCLNSTGVGAVLSASGSFSLSQQTSEPLVLHVTQARPDKSCVWLQGAGPSTPVAFRDGVLCVSNPTLRLPGGGCHPFPIQTLDSSGALSTDDPQYGFDLVAAALCKGDDIAAAAPTTREYQLWYRDGMGPCATGSNVSSSVALTWVP